MPVVTPPETAEEKLRKAFAKFDLDGDGFLTLPELRTVLTRPGGGKTMAAEQIQQLFKKMDVDGDGKVDLDEFSKALASGVAMWCSSIRWPRSTSSTPSRCSSCRSSASSSRAASTSRPRPGATRRSARVGSWSTTRHPARSLIFISHTWWDREFTDETNQPDDP